MDGSPYTPGAGHRPPVLAGRDDLLQAWSVGLSDVTASGRQRAPDMILTAPRGAGKTSTILAFQDSSEQQGFEVVRLQVASGNATLIDSLLRRARARAEEGSGPWDRAKRAFERIAAANVTISGSGAGVTLREPLSAQRGPASPEDLAEALATLAREVRKDRPGGGVLITIDEIQAAAASDLSLLGATLQGLNTEYPDARVMFAASGLPNTFQAFEQAKVTHADRLFKFKQVPLLLDPDDARFAVVEAARQHEVAWEPEAADMIIEISSGYPAHLQVFADQTWMAATGPSVITVRDAEAGIKAAAEVLEQESLGPRFDSMSDRHREFMTALAVNGGRATGEDLAVTLGRSRTSLSELRDTLITQGDVYVPRRGELALVVPVFARYLLANYGQVRPRGSAAVLPLEEMQRNAEAANNLRLARAGQRLPASGALDRPPTSEPGNTPARPARGPDRRPQTRPTKRTP